MRKLLFAVGAAGAIAAAACAAGAAAPGPEAKPQRACFRADQVRNFSAPDEDRVYVRAGVKDVYELQLMGGCPNVDWSHELGLRARGSNWICAGLDVEIVAPQPGGGRPMICPVRAVRKLTEDEVKALKRRP